MLELLKELRKKVAIGFLGGSDFVKITDQLSVTGNNGECELLVSLLPRTFNFGPQLSMTSTSHSQRMA